MKNTAEGWMWEREELEGHGLKYTGLTFPDSHHYRMHHICKELDVTLDKCLCGRITLLVAHMAALKCGNMRPVITG